MRALQPLLLAALLSPTSAEDYQPPSSGKFFYTDMTFTDDFKARYAVETTLGSSRVKSRLKVSTSDHASYIFTDACEYPSPCNIPGLYNLGSSKAKTLIEGTENEKQDIHYEDIDVRATVTGTEYKDEHLLQYEKWGRMVTFLNQFLAVDNVDQDLKLSDSQGQIGLAPYGADLDHLENNLMWQLKDQGMIDHMVTSFYIDEDDAFIKFGSFDPLGIAPGEKLVMIRTSEIIKWALTIKAPKIGSLTFGKYADQALVINPAYPHIYVTTIDTRRVEQNLIKAGQKERVSMYCDGTLCRANSRCSELTDKQKSAFDIKFQVVGSNNANYMITIPGKDLLFESEEIGYDNMYCYIGIYVENATEVNTDFWTVGSKILKNYYLVFDQTPFNERSENHNYVGIAKKNPLNVIGQQHYDPSSEYYDPEDESLDQSIDVDGFSDPYKSFAFWLRDNKGLVIFLVLLFVFVLCCVSYIIRVQCKKKKSYTFRLYSENLNKTGVQ